ncbi:Uncharacterised protein [Bordetella pertussis]|nr:Uncharacterised protein [Bordetella pertussis]CFP65506.1 Uncharacterised protein [Bordetella pertussis]CFW45756.1 Uncharacterised protein [Bordetella pertussis]
MRICCHIRRSPNVLAQPCLRASSIRLSTVGWM